MSDAPEEAKVINPLVADIFTAMFEQSENTTNQVFDNYDSVINAWKKAYRELWDTLYRLSPKIDSSRLDNALCYTEYTRQQAEDESVWSRP